MFCSSRLERLHVRRLPALGALHDVELNGLTLLEALESVRVDGGVMYEYIFAVLTADEAKPLASLNHFTVPCSIVLCSLLIVI